MVQRGAPADSRKVTRVLWFVAGAIAVAILTVRTPGIVRVSAAAMTGHPTDASRAFRVPQRGKTALYAIDRLTFSGAASGEIHATTVTTVPSDARITISGWAFDERARAPYRAIGARIDRRGLAGSANMGNVRPDVAAALKDDAAIKSGFDLTFDLKHLARGRHVLLLRALRPDGRTSVTLGSPIALDVNDAGALQHTDAIDAINGVVVSTLSLHAPIVVLRSAGTLSFWGWGFVTQGSTPASHVDVTIDGTVVAPARYGIVRQDVAAAYHDVRLSRTGISAVVSMQGLTSGDHTVRFRFARADGTTVDSASSIVLRIE